MGLIVGLTIGIIGSVLAAELFAWLPAVRSFIISVAVRLSPARYRDRLREEWFAHINELPGEILKTFVAADLIRSGLLLRLQQRGVLNIFAWRLTNIFVAAATFLFYAPLLLVVSLLLIQSGRKVFSTQIFIGARRKPFRAYRFQTTMQVGQETQFTKLGRFIAYANLTDIPMTLNIIKGDITLIGPRPRSRCNLRNLGEDGSALYLRTGPGLVSPVGFSHPQDWDRTEIEYMKNRSFAGDVDLLGRSIVEVFLRFPACDISSERP